MAKALFALRIDGARQDAGQLHLLLAQLAPVVSKALRQEAGTSSAAARPIVK